MTVRVTVTDHGAKRARELLKKKRLSLKVGVLQKEGSQRHHSGETVGTIAYWMEKGFATGTTWVEPRSWLYDWLDENEKKISKQLDADTMRVLFGGESEKAALSKRGGEYRRSIWMRIRNVPGYWQPLKPDTIRKKGHPFPLFEKGEFINAIRWEVV